MELPRFPESISESNELEVGGNKSKPFPLELPKAAAGL
jgi:hypothetical protein